MCIYDKTRFFILYPKTVKLTNHHNVAVYIFSRCGTFVAKSCAVALNRIVKAKP